MKKITQKSILQKIITTIIVALLLSNFIVPTYSHADIGGVLMDPITDLLCSVGDVVINLLQKCMTGDWGSDGFSLFKGGFLVDSETFFTSSDYAEMRTSEKGEEIDPNDPESGFRITYRNCSSIKNTVSQTSSLSRLNCLCLYGSCLDYTLIEQCIYSFYTDFIMMMIFWNF